jgi:hypothetical protein
MEGRPLIVRVVEAHRKTVVMDRNGLTTLGKGLGPSPARIDLRIRGCETAGVECRRVLDYEILARAYQIASRPNTVHHGRWSKVCSRSSNVAQTS